MNLDLLAINNLSILSEHNNDTHFLQVNDKIVFEEKEKDKDYENITELNDIEYPLYFTFNHTFTLLDNIKLSKSKKHLMNLMTSAIENIHHIYRDTIHDDNNKRIKEILKHHLNKYDNNQLGRMYFPDVNINNLSNKQKDKIIADIQKDFEYALVGLKQLNKKSFFGVYIAYMYYN